MHWNCARIRRRSTCCQRLLLLLLFITVLHRQRQLILAAETGWLRTDVGQLPAPDQTLTVIGYAGVRTPDTWKVPFCWQPDRRGNET